LSFDLVLFSHQQEEQLESSSLVALLACLLIVFFPRRCYSNKMLMKLS